MIYTYNKLTRFCMAEKKYIIDNPELMAEWDLKKTRKLD